ncbi:hypothetical protein LCGC14_0567050 [marine sediment metagenome]|uniref:Uncharacterized protein n=1 Tax=marine sediment metagenome TaxID=412755 RepID=A0A0F9UTM2_9ZZZZ
MASLLSAAGIGVFIVEEENGQINANTPGGIDLDNLSVGDTYIYLEELVRLSHTLDFGNQGDNMPGHTVNKIDAGQTGHSTGEGDLCGFTLQATVDETTAELLEKFGKLDNRTGDGKKFLVRQTASNVFRQYPNAAGTLKKYAPVIVMRVETIEVHDKGFDHILASILMVEVQTS